MSWIRIWVHLVFSTKNREKYLVDDIRSTVFKHIKENAENKNIWIDHIGGYKDHCHCLISLGKEQTIRKVAQLIKGESSFWINKYLNLKFKFSWQDDFWAKSVAESQIEEIREYIRSQEEHHKKRTFKDEIEELFMDYDLKLTE